ncbi:MAG: protein-L-isoaspartate(D-aspartate) O-methyltransferase [Pseudomonadota bacterium]
MSSLPLNSIQAQKKAIQLVMSLRNKGITDTDVLGALERVPREHFIPDALQDQAYEDIAVPIGHGQTISQPSVVAMMTAQLELTDRHKVLEIGTGTGYQACVLSKIVRRVYTIERHKPLHKIAEENFNALGLRNVTAICADGMKGWPIINGMSQAPFDRIIVTAAAREKPPEALFEQLSVGGVLMAPVGEPGNQVLKKYKRESEDTYSISDVMPVRFVPLLPDVAREEERASA